MRVIITLSLCLILPVTSFLQADIAFTAYTDADGVIPGQPFEVTFQIKNVKVQDFQAPDFGSLKVVRGPSVTNSMQLINGKRSMSRTYTYTLTGSEAGRFTIPPATATTDKGVIRSNSIQIEIKSLSEGQKRQSKSIVLEIVPSDSQVFVGEQLILDYILYFQDEIERIYPANELDFSGFYRENVNQFPRQPRKTSLQGKPYSKKIIQRDVLYAQQSGEYTFGPLFCEVEVMEENDRSPFSFFRNTYMKDVTAEPVSIQVLPLPDTLPEHFSGGIGKYQMETQVQQRQVNKGEAAEILVKIEGDGDPNVLDPPLLSIEGSAKVFDPQLVHEARNEKQGRLYFSRTWNYLVIPEQEGALSLHLKFIYLDPDGSTIDTLISPALQLWANPAGADIAGKANSNGPETPSGRGSSFWIYLITGIVLAGFIAALFIRFRTPSVRANTTGRKLEELISLIEQELKSSEPEFGRIKQEIKDILGAQGLPENRKVKLEALKKELERYQFSQERDEGKIRELLEEVLSELRKAESELE